MLNLNKDSVIRIYAGVLDKWMKNTRFALWFKIAVLLPSVLWLMLFNFYVDIPISARPKIDVTTLPAMENMLLFGHSLLGFPRNLLPEQNPLLFFLDFLAAFVYLIHFAFAWIFAGFLYLYHRERTNAKGRPIIEPWTFLFTMGILNLIAVLAQISWPTAPPWYVEQYGVEQEPSYHITGDEAGLERVDQFLQFSLFKRLYGQSPIVFGSFPSLHAAWPICIAIFIPSQLGKFWKGVGVVYVAVVWWAAMYLNHHYLVDLLGGAIFTAFSYFVATRAIALVVKHFKHKIYSRGCMHWNLFNTDGLSKRDLDLELVVIEIPKICPDNDDDCWAPARQRRCADFEIPLLKEH